MPTENQHITNRVLLMVDDDEEDVYLIRRAFCAYQTDLVFHSVSDSQNLFDYLYRRGEYENRNVIDDPQVILLDTSTPVENGLQVLKQLKADPHYANLPVVMLSNRNVPEDRSKADRLGAASYITKPVDSDGMQQFAEEFCHFWFGPEKFTASG